MTGARDPATYNHLADRELVLAAQQGQEAAYAALYDRHAVRAYRTACLLLPDRMAAEEALQDAFMRAFRSLSRFELDRPFEPWLLRIVVNECRRRSRKLQRDRVELTLARAEEMQAQRANPDDMDWLADLALRQVVAALPRLLREVIILHYYNDLAVADIASVLGCPSGTVKYRLHQARQKLASALGRTEE